MKMTQLNQPTASTMPQHIEATAAMKVSPSTETSPQRIRSTRLGVAACAALLLGKYLSPHAMPCMHTHFDAIRFGDRDGMIHLELSSLLNWRWLKSNLCS